MLPLFGLWPIQRGTANSRTNDVHSCLPLPTTWWSQWLTTGHSQPASHICRPDRLQGHAGNRCRTSRRLQQRAARNVVDAELPTISGTEIIEGWASLHRVSAACVWQAQKTRKPCYRKNDHAMRPIYGCPEKFRESQSPPATFPEICKGFLFRSILRMCVQNLKFIALSVREIIGVLKKFRQSFDMPTLHFLSNF